MKNTNTINKILLLSLLLFGVFLTWNYVIRERGENNKHTNSKSSLQAEIIDEEERYFDTPIEISWLGEVATYMESNNAYAMMMLSGNKDYNMFYAQPFDVFTDTNGDLQPKYKRGTILEISGDFLGITCAYKHSVFQGECVPDIKVNSATEVQRGK